MKFRKILSYVYMLSLVSVFLRQEVSYAGNAHYKPLPTIPEGLVTEKDGDFELSGGNIILKLTHTGQKEYRLSLSAFGETFGCTDMKEACVKVFLDGLDNASARIYSAAYDRVEKENNILLCHAVVYTLSGSTVEFFDRYSYIAERDAFRMEREVKVGKVYGRDYAFNTLYALARTDKPLATDDCLYLLPSLVYQDESNLPAHAIGADFSDKWILAREERLPMPMGLIQEKNSGVTLSITHDNNSPVTIRQDVGPRHSVCSRYGFSSLGFRLAVPSPAVAICTPGSEGERTYANVAANKRRGTWARRSHPLATDIKHTCNIEIRLTKEHSFAGALSRHWQYAFELYKPPLIEEESARSHRMLDICTELLDKYWLEDKGRPGFPFSVFLRNGKVNEISFDMGFVGMQAACGYYLYRYGCMNGNDGYKSKGEKVLDFWAENSANKVGMPRIWYDVRPWYSFRNYNDLRNMQGGMEAMIEAWCAAEKFEPGTKKSWFVFCKRCADWLVDVQAADGSWAKAYDNEGNVVDDGKMLTSNPIRFLAQMYGVTHDKRYKRAAMKAADFCYENLHIPYKYIGSVIDNPYVKDRESGQKMLESMLAVYDLSGGKRKWLDAALQAAYYTVTWMYAWNIPPYADTGTAPWNTKYSTAGITIIATGHSGADCGLAYNSFEYFRLYLLTGDPYMLHIAKILEKDTKQTMNFDGSLGYPMRGLQTEAIGLCTPRAGRGPDMWLPWVTATTLDPIYRFHDAYGGMEIEEILETDTETLKTRDRSYGRTLGLFCPFS